MSPATPAPWPLLLVTSDSKRSDEVRLATAAWPVPVALYTASNAMAGLRQALTLPLRLVIVDWAIDGPSGQALVRQLARLRPEIPVLAFDVAGVGGPAEQVLAWPWEELMTVLDHWLLLLLVDERGSATESMP